MTPAEMNQAVIRGLVDKTGRSIDEWVLALGQCPASDRKSRVDWLKTSFHLGHVTATIIVDYARNEAHLQLDPEDLLAALRQRCSAEAQHQLDAVLEWAEMTPGVTIVPCKGYIGLKAKRQFAALRPKDRRLEIGLALELDLDSDFHAVRGLGGGRIRSGIWGDQDWRPRLVRALDSEGNR